MLPHSYLSCMHTYRASKLTYRKFKSLPTARHGTARHVHIMNVLCCKRVLKVHTKYQSAIPSNKDSSFLDGNPTGQGGKCRWFWWQIWPFKWRFLVWSLPPLRWCRSLVWHFITLARDPVGAVFASWYDSVSSMLAMKRWLTVRSGMNLYYSPTCALSMLW